MARQILGKVVPTGEDTYDNSRTYDELCIVMYNGQSYISKKETRGNKPDNTEYWQQLVEKPVKGTDYFTEADKDEIVNDVTNDATNKYNQAVTTGIETFNQNAERKTSDFNDNASEKTDTYNANADSTTQAFTDNANSKTEAYNTNATEKLGTYNSNHTAKLKEYNDNATSKLSAYNTNSVTKTNEYNSNHTSKINAYDTNASNKVGVYNTNADTRLEEYNTNADNKIAEYDEHSKELNNKIVSTRNELERLKSNVLNTGEDTDTFIHLEDSAMAELQELSVDGVCKQETTTGANLIGNKNNDVLEKNGLTFTKNSDGSVTVNGTSTELTWYLLTNKKDYDDGNYYVYVKTTDNNLTFYMDNPIGRCTNSKIVSLSSYTQKDASLIIPSGVTLNNAKIYFMLAKSDIKLPYEKFTGGATPRPDYPQPISTIENSLKITSCGKNLNPNIGVDFKAGTSIPIFLKKGTYTFNLDTKQPLGTGTNLYIGIYDKNGTQIKEPNHILGVDYSSTSGFYYGGGTGAEIGKKVTITTDNNYIIQCGFNNIIPTSGSQLMLSKGTEIADYEPYQETVLTINLPDGEFIGKINDTYKDTLKVEYNEEDEQYHLKLYKNIGKVVLENFTWVMSAIEDNEYSLWSCYDIPNIKYVDNNQTIGNGIAEKYIIHKGSGMTNAYNHIDIDIGRVIVNTKESPTGLFYYEIATPYVLDLGVIDMPMSYKDITNIFTDSDLLPTINAKYYRVFNKTIQNAQINEKTLKQEITDLNATVSALDTRLKALETKTVEEPTESEGTV